MHGNTKRAILRRWDQGFRVSAICREFGVSYAMVRAVLIDSGIGALTIRGRIAGLRHQQGNERKLVSHGNRHD